MFENSFSKSNTSNNACSGMPYSRALNLIITDTVILAASVFVISVLLLVVLLVSVSSIIISLLISLIIILSLLVLLIVGTLKKQRTFLMYLRT